MLPREALHPRIADAVWRAFMRGEFDVAVFLAMKAVEVSVRDACGLGIEILGVPLMRAAFKPDGGVLTDTLAEAGERTGRMELFAGTIGSFNLNPAVDPEGVSRPLDLIEVPTAAHLTQRVIRCCSVSGSGVKPSQETTAPTAGFRFKNPQSHRDVNLNDPAEALEIIFLANYLLRIVDVRARSLADAKPSPLP